MPTMIEKKKRYSRKELLDLAFPGTPERNDYTGRYITTYKEAYEYFKKGYYEFKTINKELRELAYTSHTGEKYKDLYEALYDESVSTKMVEAFFQYQDGQSTTVEAEMKFYTMEGVA